MNTNVKIVIAIIVVIVIVVLGFIYFSPTLDNGSPADISNTSDTNTNVSNTNTNTTPPDTTSVVKEFQVNGQNYAFSQSEIRVKEGDKVKIVFTSTSGFHNWMIDEFSAATSKVTTGNSSSVEFIASRKGTFQFYCGVGNHRSLGMVGNLIVE